MVRCVTWLFGWGHLILNHHPARFGVHRPNGTGNNGVCCISSNSISNSNSNAEVYKWPFFRPIRIANFSRWLIVTQKMNYILIKTTLIIMCLNQSLKLKSSWHFAKWISLNTVFMIHHIHNFEDFLRPCNHFPTHIP